MPHLLALSSRWDLACLLVIGTFGGMLLIALYLLAQLRRLSGLRPGTEGWLRDVPPGEAPIARP